MWDEDLLDQFELTPNTPDWLDDEAGFFESAKRSYDYISKTRLTRSSKPMEADIFDRNVKLQGLIDAGEIDARPFYRQPEKVDAFSVGFELYDFDGLASYAKQQGHEVETDEEIRGRYRADALRSEEEFKEADSIAGSLVGGMAAQMTDPVLIASSLLGIGAARNVATATRMGLLAVENAGVEAITIPDKRAYAKEINQEYGPNEAALDVLMAAAMPPALDTAARAVGKALKMLPDRTKQVDTMADSLLEAPEGRTIADHFGAQERAISNIEQPKRQIAQEEAAPDVDEIELNRQFEKIDDQQAKAEIAEIEKANNDFDIIEACLSGRL